MNQRVIIWDNDGTITGSLNPNDPTKTILPNVAKVMTLPEVINVICSGCKTPESEQQNFSPEVVIKKFTDIMSKLPIQAATFSPTIGGVHCFVMIKPEPKASIEIRKAHEDPRYQHLISQFKKPGVGMLIVIKDLLKDVWGLDMSQAVMIGDTWHDQEAAHAAGIPFRQAQTIHTMLPDSDFEAYVFP